MALKSLRWTGIGLVLVAVTSFPALLRSANGTAAVIAPSVRQDPRLSLMTYNVEGLPWPVRFSRDAALARIRDRLETLRMQGEQPHIVALQEAFTAEAKAVGPQSGYRYVADGPGKDLAGAPASRPADREFERQTSIFRGERSGKLVGSGLQILSDYPILSIRRMAFPSYACAGFDCLANKGALLAMIAVPGLSEPLAIVDVHLNSHKASGADDARSLYAYRGQIDALDRFLGDAVKPGTPVIVAGDFNVGNRPTRRAYFEAFARRWGSGTAQGSMRDALGMCLSPMAPCGADIPPDARFSAQRGRDWQISIPGFAYALDARSLAVPFGHELDGTMLSDHVGYTAYYVRTDSPRIAGNTALRG